MGAWVGWAALAIPRLSFLTLTTCSDDSKPYMILNTMLKVLGGAMGRYVGDRLDYKIVHPFVG